MNADGKLLREGPVAARLGVSKRTLQKWRVTGRGPRYVRLGRAVAYDPADLADFIEAGRRRSTSDPGPGTAGAVTRKLAESDPPLSPEEIGRWAAAKVEAEYAARGRRASI